MLYLSLAPFFATFLLQVTLAEKNDWINPQYVIDLGKRPTAATNKARQSIINHAINGLAGGPWSVTQSPALPPSGDNKDYLSWAPYYWPQCNWCGKSNKRSEFEGDDQYFYEAPSTTSEPTSVLGPTAAPTEVPIKAARTSSKDDNKCTPSRTSVAPTATYTTCKYVQRDGKVNPDTLKLEGPSYIGKTAYVAINNAIAWALTGDRQFSKNAAHYLDYFFLDSKTGLNPNVNYGQTIRGPDRTDGSFMALVDFRSMIKVANAVQILRQSQAPDWTFELDGKMTNWVRLYIQWLRSSPLAQKAAVASNNHGSFYYNQLASLQVMIGDYAGARKSLQTFIANSFAHQITGQGEQPFESVRTRAFHYRAFNLEALVTNAKVADQLGIDMWTAPTYYNATIQDAIDFTMTVNPGRDDITELVPHVAAIAAACGDPTGKYLRFIKKYQPDYESQYFWLYDQPDAFVTSPERKAGRVSIPPTSPPPTKSSSKSKSKSKKPRSPNRNKAVREFMPTIVHGPRDFIPASSILYVVGAGSNSTFKGVDGKTLHRRLVVGSAAAAAVAAGK